MENGFGRMQVRCIVFGDMEGSTPASVSEMRAGNGAAHHAGIWRCLDLWRELFHPFGLEFFKTMGDGFIATFPEPLAAVRAVLHARDTVERDAQCQAFPLRIGVHVGGMIIAPDGDPAGADVILAQRVMSRAFAGETLLSAACANMVTPYLHDLDVEDLGEEPLKGFDRPVRLYSVRQPGARKRQRVSGVGSRGNLPISLDRLVGRVAERALLRRYLVDPIQRGVTLVGATGTGKTRLATEVASEVHPEFPDGVLFVSLEGAATADSVLSRIAATLSIPLNVQTDPHVAVRSAMSHLHTLLILDNFEQALSAAAVVPGLLKSLPLLHIVATSSVPLRYHGERVLDLSPLSVAAESAPFSKIRASESVKLFVERARAANASFKLTAENAMDVAALCGAVGGLPLAIEILASEVRSRPLSRLREMRAELLDIGAGLVDVPERQRSLRSALDWAYGTLSESDRRLFEQLSIFETPFGDEAYEVCTAGDIEQGLHRLQARGFLTSPEQGDDRPYRMLLPAREYARQRLGEPSGALRDRYVAAFTRKAQNLYDLWRRHAEASAVQAVRADLENFRSAWRMAHEDRRTEAIADLGMPITFFAPSLPRSAELEDWLEPLEDALRRLGDASRLGIVSNTRARLASRRGAFDQAVERQRESLAHMEAGGTTSEIADAHATLAFFAFRAEQFDTADLHASLAVKVVGRDAGAGEHGGALPRDAETLAVAYLVLAQLTLARANQGSPEAERLARESLELFKAEGVCRGMAHACEVLARIAESRKDFRCAEECYRDSLSLCLGEGEEVQVVRSAEALASFYLRRGIRTTAGDLLAAAEASRRILGMSRPAEAGNPPSREADAVALRSVASRVLAVPLQAAA